MTLQCTAYEASTQSDEGEALDDVVGVPCQACGASMQLIEKFAAQKTWVYQPLILDSS